MVFSNSTSYKITIRFLSNEIRPDNLKIIVHKKRCASATNCTVSQLGNNEISNELLSSIIKTAAVLEKEDKKKTKRNNGKSKFSGHWKQMAKKIF